MGGRAGPVLGCEGSWSGRCQGVAAWGAGSRQALSRRRVEAVGAFTLGERSPIGAVLSPPPQGIFGSECLEPFGLQAGVGQAARGRARGRSAPCPCRTAPGKVSRPKGSRRAMVRRCAMAWHRGRDARGVRWTHVIGSRRIPCWVMSSGSQDPGVGMRTGGVSQDK